MKQLIPGNEVESPQNKSHYMQNFFVDIFYGIGFNWLAPDRGNFAWEFSTGTESNQAKSNVFWNNGCKDVLSSVSEKDIK